MSIGEFHFIRPKWLLLVPVALLIWWRLRESLDPLLGWAQ